MCKGIFFCLFSGPGRSSGDRTDTVVPTITPVRGYVGGVASDLMGPPIPTHPLTHNKKHSPFHGVHQVSCFVVVYFIHVVVYFMHVVKCSRGPHTMRRGQAICDPTRCVLSSDCM